MYLEHLLPASLNATGKLTTTGIGISIANGAGNTAYIEGPSEIWIDPHPCWCWYRLPGPLELGVIYM